MAQEFVIKSADIEDKINQLLPSQGGFQPGVDFSASTMVIPIVDLTETAEGSLLRQDLQTAYSLNNITSTQTINTTNTIITTTGFFQIDIVSAMGANSFNNVAITDGVTTKVLFTHTVNATSAQGTIEKRIVANLKAGDSCTVTSGNASGIIQTISRQLADLDGNLVNP